MRSGSGSGKEEEGESEGKEGGRRTYRYGSGSGIGRGRGRYGVAMVGSAPHFVENFNVRLSPSVSRGKATSLARMLRKRDGALSGLEALILPRRDDGDDNDGGGGVGGGGGGYEVACNLLRPGEGEGSSSAKDVSERLREWIYLSSRKKRTLPQLDPPTCIR